MDRSSPRGMPRDPAQAANGCAGIRDGGLKAGAFSWNGVELVSQAEIERQPGSRPPVVLPIKPVSVHAVIAVVDSARYRCGLLVDPVFYKEIEGISAAGRAEIDRPKGAAAFRVNDRMRLPRKPNFMACFPRVQKTSSLTLPQFCKWKLGEKGSGPSGVKALPKVLRPFPMATRPIGARWRTKRWTPAPTRWARLAPDRR